MTPFKFPKWLLWLAAASVVAIAADMRGCSPLVTTKVTAVTYFYDEKAVIPSGVEVAINELNARPGLVASKHPDDGTDGDGDVPDQYKVSLPAAKDKGIPSLVVMGGDRVLRVVKAPTTKEQVLEAAQ